jgi:hypothetical protein
MEAPVRRLPGGYIRRCITIERRTFRLIKDGGRRIRSSVAQSQDLKSSSHAGDLLHLGKIERRYPHPSPRLTDRKPLCLQPPKRLAHRHMTGAKLIGKMILLKLRTGQQGACHDLVGQNAADPAGDCLIIKIGLA